MNQAPLNIWMHRYAVITAAMTLLLLCAGGLVTSHGAGLAVPDWPNTFGSFMFFFPISQWIGGVFYEHTHRLIASTVGFMTLVLSFWLWRKESRKWLRRLGWVALIAVIAQGVLGGLRVVWLMDEIGIVHATLAQLFFVLICGIALFTSRAWQETQSQPSGMEAARVLLAMFAVATGFVLLQLILGATMRHQHAGLPVPDFPLAYGRLWPDTSDAAVAAYNQLRMEVVALNPITANQILLHMAHRVGAALVLIALAVCVRRSIRNLGARHSVTRITLVWLGLVLFQLLLGASTVWSDKLPLIATAHVAFGALTLAWGFLLCFWVCRYFGLVTGWASDPASATFTASALRVVPSPTRAK